MAPQKPTRAHATGSTQPEKMSEDTVAPSIGGTHIAGSSREERGSAAENAKHPPHVTENDHGAPLQQKEDRPGDIAARPANASGHEEIPPTNGGINPTSMYDRRPEEDKDNPPSERAR